MTAARLSPREHEVLVAIADGLTNELIAGRLGCGIETVKTHQKRICRKLSARGRTHAVAVAFRSGVLE